MTCTALTCEPHRSTKTCLETCSYGDANIHCMPLGSLNRRLSMNEFLPKAARRILQATASVAGSRSCKLCMCSCYAGAKLTIWVEWMSSWCRACLSQACIHSFCFESSSLANHRQRDTVMFVSAGMQRQMAYLFHLLYCKRFDAFQFAA